MNLAEDSKIRPIDCYSPLEISTWCRDYLRYNRYPCNIIERYAIGIYQIYQGLEWAEPQNKAESFMSASLHFLMTCEMLNLEVLIDLNQETKPFTGERILYLISKAQQQIFYFHKSTKRSLDGQVYQRASRYNKKQTSLFLQELINNLVALVPSMYRNQGLFDASKIMSGIL